jgi:peptidoglycan/LPS O-acetylase OafA/YrhL
LLLLSLFIPGDYPAPHIVLSAALGSAALIWAGINAEGRLFHSRLLTLLGDASYSIYLVHMYFVAAAITVWRRFLPELPYWQLVPIAFVCGAIGGVAVHLAVEKPFMRLFARKSPKKAGKGGALPDGVSPALVTEPSASAHRI